MWAAPGLTARLPVGTRLPLGHSPLREKGHVSFTVVVPASGTRTALSAAAADTVHRSQETTHTSPEVSRF